jgi:hypothetical protein
MNETIKIYDLKNQTLNKLDLEDDFLLESTSQETKTMDSVLSDWFPFNLIGYLSFPTIYLNIKDINYGIIDESVSGDFAFYHIKHNSIFLSTNYTNYGDVISHELGHYLLCSISKRYQKFDKNVMSIHEGFADVISILYEVKRNNIDIDLPINLLSRKDNDFWYLGDDIKIRKLTHNTNGNDIYTNGDRIVSAFLKIVNIIGIRRSFQHIYNILSNNNNIKSFDLLISSIININTETVQGVVGFDREPNINIYYVMILAGISALLIFG